MSNSDHNYGIAAAELRQFIEQLEGCDAEIKDVQERKKEIRAEMKARGYDTKVAGIVMKRRKRDKDDLAEEAALVEMYEGALLV